jgi:hypothetical protein
MTATTHSEFTTVLVLMKGPETDATLDALEASGQDVEILDEGPFWKVLGRGDIHIELADVVENLGAPLTMGKWLVSMTSFVGNVQSTADSFTVRTQNGAGIER